jgi:predicted MFS family arabinose efflux permease
MRLLMLCSAVQGGFMSWGFYAWQPYFLELLGTNAVWVAGLIAALIALATVLGNALVDWMSQFCGKRSTILGWAVAAQAVAAVGVGLADSFWLAAGLFLIVAMAMGVMGPVQQAYLHNSIPTSHRASVISFNSMMGNAGGIIGQAGLGYLSRVRSIADGYVVGGVVTLLALPVVLLLRRTGGPADVIVGAKAALDGTCAPQGIPSISQVDATPVALDTDE